MAHAASHVGRCSGVYPVERDAFSSARLPGGARAWEDVRAVELAQEKEPAAKNRGWAVVVDGVRRIGRALAEEARSHAVTVVDGDLTTPEGLTVRSTHVRRGERVTLGVGDEEVWVVLRGHLQLATLTGVVTARTGDVLHVPESSPGDVEALDDTAVVSVAVR